MIDGVLRLSAPLSFGIAHLSRLLPGFQSRYPKLRLDIDLSDRVVDLVGRLPRQIDRLGALLGELEIRTTQPCRRRQPSNENLTHQVSRFRTSTVSRWLSTTVSCWLRSENLMLTMPAPGLEADSRRLTHSALSEMRSPGRTGWWKRTSS